MRKLTYRVEYTLSRIGDGSRIRDNWVLAGVAYDLDIDLLKRF